MFINKNLIEFIKGNVSKVINNTMLQLLVTLISTAIFLCVAIIVRMILGEEKILFFNSIFQVFLVAFLLILIRYIILKFKVVVSEKSGLAIKSSLRERLLNKLFKLGPSYIYNDRTGNIASSISTKVEFLTDYYTMYLPSALSTIINSIVIIYIIYLINKITAIVAIIGFLGLLFSPIIFFNLMKKRGRYEMKIHAEYYSDCLDSIQGIVTLKSFNANNRQKKYIYNQGEKLRKATMAQLRVTIIENLVLQLFLGIGSMISVVTAAYQTLNGNIDKDLLVYVYFLIGSCFFPAKILINSWHLGYRGIVASESINKLLKQKVYLDLYDKKQIQEMDEILIENSEGNQHILKNYDISFNNVYFSYNKEKGDVLKDISFNIPEKTSVAIIGMSGSGKTTIASILAGFYMNQRGRIKIGDLELNKENIYKIQNQISAVWQDCHIFNMTIEENILVAKPSASYDDMIEAAKKANIHNFISTLPLGYKTILGEDGSRLSGGQKQRIALARVFLKNTPIVILDEATSSLDRKNEIEIQKAFNNLKNNKTVITIAHRFETIKNADQIIILDSGEIIDIGNHSELLKRSEEYNKIMGSQVSR